MAKDHSKEQSEPKDEGQKASSKLPSEKKNSEKTLFGIDYYLISTVSLAVISLCALLVSIYQTNVLSGQQEVMDEQQKIMRSQQELMQQNAKAQLWPRLRVTRSTSYKKGELNELQFEISNEGTGPAIVEYIAMGYNGNYATSWYDLFLRASLLDSIPFIISNHPINNRVIQAGERYAFLSLNENPALMNRIEADIKSDKGLELVLCYRSVFYEHWIIEGKMGDLFSTAPTQVDSCIVSEKPMFQN